MKRDEISLRTKLRISAALKARMAAQPFDQITVSDLLRDCDLSRPTFYYHFEDKYDLLKWTLEHDIVDLLRQGRDCSEWCDSFLLVLRYVQDNVDLCRCAWRHVGKDALEQMCYADVRALMDDYIDSLDVEPAPPAQDVAFVADFYTRALVAQLASWMQNGMTTSPEDMVALLERTVRDSIRFALEHSAAAAQTGDSQSPA